MTALEPAAPLAADSPLHRFDVWLAEAAHAADELAAQGDLDGLALWLAQARHMRRSLGDVERILEDHVAALMPQKRWEHDELGVLERRKGSDRKKWRWDEVLDDAWPLYVAKHEGDMGEAMADMLTTLIPLTGSNGPRVTAMRDLGLDPDEYAEVTPARTTVQIHTKDAALAVERREAVATDDPFGWPTPAITEGGGV